MGRWLPNKPNKHPKLAVEVSLCQDANNKKGLKAPTTPGEQHTIMVTAMPDTGASMCLGDMCVTTRIRINGTGKIGKPKPNLPGRTRPSTLYTEM